LADIGIAAYLGEEEAAKKRCLKKYKKANAFSPETAITPEKAGIAWHEKNALKTLVKKGKIKKTEDGRYYLPWENKK
jgi:hypothetical protein